MKLNPTAPFLEFIKPFVHEDAQALVHPLFKMPKVLRVFVQAGGCQGFTYAMSVEPEQEGDVEMFNDGTYRIVSDKKSAPILNGAVLDHEGGLNGRGVTFKHPNASQCGCGTSFCPAGLTSKNEGC